jgi:hypothetical protein
MQYYLAFAGSKIEVEFQLAGAKGDVAGQVAILANVSNFS